MRHFLNIFFLFIIVTISCDQYPNRYSEDSFNCPGMCKISSAGKTFLQGWDNASASIDEEPVASCSFTYNYWLDSTEVTQQLFASVMGRSPVTDTSRYGTDGQCPVYNVTWFDAVLFCNSRSKTEGLDTVYTYSHAAVLPNGSVIDLTGVCSDFAKDGYRLPTEAEWEFAARGGSDEMPYSDPADSAEVDRGAWYIGDSGNRTHPVAGKRENGYGLYDMAGNVFEWTNDWKGAYDGKIIHNSLGSMQPNGEFEKVIKGGAFCYGRIFLRPSCRSANYSTLLSTATYYVGFRCARGRIDNGSYRGSISPGNATNPVFLSATAAQVGSFTGASGCRIVFVNVQPSGRTLCFADFGKPFPYVYEFRDDWSVYTPAISPDGKYVAYSSGNEGQSSPAVITVRSLDSTDQPGIRLTADTAYIPRWWISPTSGDTFIVYTNSAIMNSDPLWASKTTFLQKIGGGKPSGHPTLLVADGGYHDGVSTDGRFIISAYTRLMMKDMVTDSVRQLFVYPENGKDPSGSTQVCNASMSPDKGKEPRCLFLDFGCQTQSSVTGCSYFVHQYLFVSTMSGLIKKAVACPGNDNSWDCTEWSNHENYAVATMRNASGQANEIYLINLVLQETAVLVKGNELQQPAVWLNNFSDPTQVGNDSIGAYNDPAVHATQARFAYRMQYFWQLYDSIEYLFVGSSHAAFSIDPHSFSRHHVFNMAFGQCDPATSRAIIRNYVLTHCTKLKFIGIDFVPGFFSALQGGDASFSIGIGASKGYRFDSGRAFWRNSLDDVRSRLISRNTPAVDGLDSLNLESSDCNGWGGDNPGMYGGGGWDTSSAEFKYNAELWEQLIGHLDSLGITVLFFITPENPAFAAMGFSGRYGPSLEAGKDIISYFEALQKRYRRFHLYDANKSGNHDYSDSEAWDPDHLCQVGARKFSSRIDSVMTEIMP